MIMNVLTSLGPMLTLLSHALHYEMVKLTTSSSTLPNVPTGVEV